MNALRPENVELLKLSKVPKVKAQSALFDGSLSTAKSSSHNHDIRTHKLNTANMLQPVVTSTTAKELTATESYSLNGVSLSKKQFQQLTNNS